MASPKAQRSPQPAAKPKAKQKTKAKVNAKAATQPAKRTTAAAARTTVDAAERQRMIGEAAYYIAERRGFAPGHHDADWAEAVRQVSALLKKR